MAGSYFFEKVHDLTAASRGEPGNRFFFVVAGTEEGWVRVWMEKEQLRALADRLVALRPGIKVLFMSGYSEEVVQKNGFVNSGVNFLVKPVAPVELLQKVRDIMTSTAPLI